MTKADSPPHSHSRMAGARHSGDPEPHRRRHLEILRAHPEIRTLYGNDPRTAFITVIVVAGQIAVAAAFAWAARRGSPIGSWPAVLAVAWPLGAIAAKWSGVAIHEASHNLVLRTPRANRLFAILANAPLLVPSAMTFRRYHLDHHVHLGVTGRDNDLAQRFEIEWVGRSSVRKLLWLTCYVFFGTLARDFVRRPNRWELLNLGVQLVIDALLFWLLGPTAILYLALSLFFGFGLHPVAGHFIHEHYLWRADQESYSYYGPLNRVTLNLGYHVEHHDFMRVPSSRLPQLRRMAREHYDALVSHDSWTWVMWHFVVTPSLGHDARMTRAARPIAAASAGQARAES